MKTATKLDDISEWCKQIITGPTGLISYEEHEFIVWHIPRDRAVAEWVIRCLANRYSEGSEEVLNAIIRHRERSKHKYKEQKTVSMIERAFLAGRSKTTWEQFKKDNGLCT